MKVRALELSEIEPLAVTTAVPIIAPAVEFPGISTFADKLPIVIVTNVSGEKKKVYFSLQRREQE